MRLIRFFFLASTMTTTPFYLLGQTFQDGIDAYEGGDYATAAEIVEPFAYGGNGQAMLLFGTLYENGNGVPQDYAEAVNWFRLASEQGMASAQFMLGWMYQQGDGVPQDYAEAVNWYRMAAKQGEAWAQNSLGVMYGKGEGVPQNFTNAYILFNLAAAQGNENARKHREIAAEELTPDQLAEARSLSSEWEVGEPLPLQGD